MRKELFLVLLALLVVVSGCKQVGDECVKDEDCVVASCCHPKECVPIGQKPDCTGMMCTLNCEPGTMDCGQGSCMCVKGVCKAVLSS